MAAVGNDAVKRANHCVSYTTGRPFLVLVLAVAMAGGRVRSFAQGGEPYLRTRGNEPIT